MRPIALLLIPVVATLVLATCAFAVGALGSRISVEGTRFVVTSVDGRRFDPLVGAKLDLGIRRTVRIDAVERDKNSIGEVWLYRLSAPRSDGRWEDICTADPEGRQAAFPLPGYFDARGHFVSDLRRFTLVCTSGAQGKCVRLGYRPWERDAQGRSMAPTYDACVRMMRADYCGDGRSFTRDGTRIEIANRGQAESFDARESTFGFEAAWGQDGAICVARPRIPDEISLTLLAATCPRLRGHLGASQCSPNARGALLLNNSRVDDRQQ
jgi:hypothetical protein